MTDIVDEGSTFKTTVSFFDYDGNPATPTAATYKIDDVMTGASIRAEGAFPSLATSVDLTLTPSDTAIVVPSVGYVGRGPIAYEERVLSIEATYGASDQKKQQEYRFRVRNLRFT